MAREALTPMRLAGLELRNRVIKAATYEGMSPGGMPSARLIEHHAKIAAGGVAMTTLAYACVAPQGRTFADQLVLAPALVKPLRALTDAVHEGGAAASIQLAHCGGFSKDKGQRGLDPPGPHGPSLALNRYGLMQGLVWTRAMSVAQIEAIPAQFARAARLALEAGFDALEVHLGHGYLLSQFLSPAINRRRDAYGGSVDNRLRLPLAVIAAVREAVGAQVPILCKTNLRDDIRGGLEVEEAVVIAQALEAAGVDALVLSGGVVSHSAFYLLRGGRPLREMVAAEPDAKQRFALRVFGPAMIEAHPFEEMFFLPLAQQIRAAVDMPLCLLGGIVSAQNLDQAMAEGFELVAMGRALLENPELINQIAGGEAERSACNHCNICVAEMDVGGVSCVLHTPASG